MNTPVGFTREKLYVLRGVALKNRKGANPPQRHQRSTRAECLHGFVTRPAPPRRAAARGKAAGNRRRPTPLAKPPRCLRASSQRWTHCSWAPAAQLLRERAKLQPLPRKQTSSAVLAPFPRFCAAPTPKLRALRPPARCALLPCAPLSPRHHTAIRPSSTVVPVTAEKMDLANLTERGVKFVLIAAYKSRKYIYKTSGVKKCNLHDGCSAAPCATP